MVERQVVALVVVGSSPITHPILPFPNVSVFNPAPVAQLDRAPDFESVGRRFESFRARHFLKRFRQLTVGTTVGIHENQVMLLYAFTGIGVMAFFCALPERKRCSTLIIQY